MTEKQSEESRSERYRGTLTLPGEQEPRHVSLSLDREGQAVTIHFETPVAGATEWKGSSVQVARRLKYYEAVFITTGLPKGAVELTWKLNAGLEDGTLAGVVIARPNEERVSGEKGFVLVKPV